MRAAPTKQAAAAAIAAGGDPAIFALTVAISTSNSFLIPTHQVNALIVGGIGMRPLMGFRQVGIDVYHEGERIDIRPVVEDLLAGKLPLISDDEVCGGGGGNGGSSDSVESFSATFCTWPLLTRTRTT